ncbi:MAG: hypothetical protein KatS3mg009_0436 [Acidimicrobiia bacterium]|nr:MAG: hypothetical protein KatS3mg009_0436 [Acidimicrobiia bacterium]
MCTSQVGRVLEVRDRAEAVVEVDGAPRLVSTVALVLEGTPPAPGDWLLIHTGFAIEVLDAAEAGELAALGRALRATREERTG